MKVLLIGCLLTTMVNADTNLVMVKANSGCFNPTQSMQEVKVPAVEQAVNDLNSYTAMGIYSFGRGIDMIGTGLKYVGGSISAVGATVMALEKAIVSGMSAPLSYTAQVYLEYKAWKATSQTAGFALKDLADTVESRGAKSSYVSKIANLATYAGAGIYSLGYGFSWLGKKMCGYAVSI